MNIFNNDGKVICVDCFGTCSLKENEVYTISRQMHNGHVYLKELGNTNCYRSTRFILVEDEPNYMMVWERKEKNAIKLEVVANLNNNPRFHGDFAVVSINLSGETVLFRHCKSIEQWRKDNVLFTNSLEEDFFEEDTVFWVDKATNKINSASIGAILTQEGFRDSEYTTEIMTKYSAEKYIKEHEVVVVEMTMEEVCKELGKNVKIVK